MTTAKKTINPEPHSLGKKAFTIVELMVAVTIFTMLGFSIYYTSFSLSNLLMKSELKLQINAEMRKMTNEIIQHARFSDTIHLYASVTQFANEVAVGQEGDFLVIIDYGDLNTDSNSSHHGKSPIKEMVCYFRDNEFLKKIPVEITTSNQYTEYSQILTNIDPSKAKVISKITNNSNAKVFSKISHASYRTNTYVSRDQQLQLSNNLYNTIITNRNS